MTFLLFSNLFYYPEGGARDCDGAFDTEEDAKAAFEPIGAMTHSGGWAHIAKLEDGRLTIVAEWEAFPVHDPTAPTEWYSV